MSTTLSPSTPTRRAKTAGDRPRALVLRAAGVNCDPETAHAFTLAGAEAVTLHVNRLMENPTLLEDFDLLSVPGGFSYGDDIAAGRILSDQLNRALGEPLRRFVDRGGPVMGICNGFQVLIQTDILPGRIDGEAAKPCALTENRQGHYVCRWVSLKKAARHCVWTSDWGDDELVELPMAHAEGRLVFRDEESLRRLREADRVAVRYAGPDRTLAADLPLDLPVNPNGSADDIAGLCDESGLVMGLMPHPERYVDAMQHPAWTRMRVEGRMPEVTPGLQMFRSAVAHVVRTK